MTMIMDRENDKNTLSLTDIELANTWNHHICHFSSVSYCFKTNSL